MAFFFATSRNKFSKPGHSSSYIQYINLQYISKKMASVSLYSNETDRFVWPFNAQMKILKIWILLAEGS